MTVQAMEIGVESTALPFDGTPCVGMKAASSHSIKSSKWQSRRLASIAKLNELQVQELAELRVLVTQAICDRLGVQESRQLTLALSQVERLCSALIQSQSPHRDALRPLFVVSDALKNLYQLLPALDLSTDAFGLSAPLTHSHGMVASSSALASEAIDKGAAASNSPRARRAGGSSALPPRTAPHMGASRSLASMR